MTIDFAPEPEYQAKLDWAARFVREEVEPLDRWIMDARGAPGSAPDIVFEGPPAEKRAFDKQVKALQDQVKANGMWALHLSKDLGGLGYGQVKLALLNEILGRSGMAPTVFGNRAPDSGNAELIAHNGTQAQKDRWLKPLLNGEFRSCYSMTEPHAGSDPGEFKTRAWREGDGWVLDGEKWFSSYADQSELLIVMAITSPDAPLAQRASMFLVPRHTPGVEIVRNVGMMHQKFGGGEHGYVRYNKVKLPEDALLGKEGSGFLGAQTRLSGGRVHHAMRTVGVCTQALEMICERALSRTTKGELLADKQMVQDMIADSYIQLKQFRLHVLYAAWLIDRDKAYTREVRTEIAAVKVAAPKVLQDIVYRAIHLHGSLGVSNETRLAQMWVAVPTMGIHDGPSEVHKVTIARQVLRGHKASPDLFPTYHLPKEIAAARAKFADLIERQVLEEA